MIVSTMFCYKLVVWCGSFPVYDLVLSVSDPLLSCLIIGAHSKSNIFEGSTASITALGDTTFISHAYIIESVKSIMNYSVEQCPVCNTDCDHYLSGP